MAIPPLLNSFRSLAFLRRPDNPFTPGLRILADRAISAATQKPIMPESPGPLRPFPVQISLTQLRRKSFLQSLLNSPSNLGRSAVTLTLLKYQAL
jgi:hypothetical protein